VEFTRQAVNFQSIIFTTINEKSVSELSEF